MHGQELEAGCLCIHTPGHTPGGCCFHFTGQELLVAGDTLFRGSVGRSYLPGGSGAQLLSSIRDRLYTLNDATIVMTGHGPDTTIGHEKRHNALLTQPGPAGRLRLLHRPRTRKRHGLRPPQIGSQHVPPGRQRQTHGLTRLSEVFEVKLLVPRELLVGSDKRHLCVAGNVARHALLHRKLVLE